MRVGSIVLPPAVGYLRVHLHFLHSRLLESCTMASLRESSFKEPTPLPSADHRLFPQSPSTASSPSSSEALPKNRRRSVYKELDTSSYREDGATTRLPRIARSGKQVRFRNQLDVQEAPNFGDTGSSAVEIANISMARKPLRSALVSTTSPVSQRQSLLSSIPRLYYFTVFFAIFLHLLHNSPLVGKAGYLAIGVEGSIVRTPVTERRVLDERNAELVERDDSATDICKRWAHQTAVVNGTIYIYGGQSITETKQANDTWNNDLFTLDLTKKWEISAPALKPQSQPTGPPRVATAFLWNSLTSLFLYGGAYADNEDPLPSPAPFSLWEYDIASSEWKEHKNPKTSSGINSEAGNQPVLNVAEGAGISVPEIGRGFYFGGHQDFRTTSGWSDQVPRIYLKSLLEFTYPGHTNEAVDDLKGGKPAGIDGVWRNITQGGLQDRPGFTKRADGVLVYVPGFGKEGILLGLAGGTDATFTKMNIIDVYDIASSTWYKQPTAGEAPGIRVNPCAVAASAADGSSTNIYMYGGQNLEPYKAQVQFDDMWILTVPSFTWIQVDQEGQSGPPARAGHTCDIWDGQMVVVGGYVAQNITCDSPGIYVFDASELKWQNSFTVLNGANAQNQQSAQSQNSYGLSGSYGYQVPAAVQSVIGGGGLGGATVTAPVQQATEGPLATGKPIIYTVTDSNGATVTETSTVTGGSNPNGSSQQKGGPNIAAIVAGVVAGLFAVLAGYLGFCAWIYRRQLALYKNHVAMSQRAAANGPDEKTGFLYPTSTQGSSGARGKFSDRSSGITGSATGRSGAGSGSASVPPMPGSIIAPAGGNSTANSSTEDLRTWEPSFVGVLLNPRRSLRVINRD